MLIRFRRGAFNLTTFSVFGSIACVVLALTLPFQFFRPDIELLLRLLADTRIERETAFVEIAMRFSPWFVAASVVGIGAYLALERNPG